MSLSAQHRDAAACVNLLITLAGMAASIALVFTFPDIVAIVRDDPVKAGAFLLLTLALQLFTVEIYGRGSIGVSVIGLLAAAFSLGPGPAMAIAFIAALAQWIRRRGRFHRAIFDAANLALSAGTAAAVFALLTAVDQSVATKVPAATLAGIAYSVVNYGLLCFAMGLTEGQSIRSIWRERFHWARFHILAFGPLAAASSIAYDKTGVSGLLAFALPPALLVLTVRQYLERTRDAVEEVRAANRELQVANDELAARNEDLQALFQFAGGLSSCANDQRALVAYAENSLTRLTGATAQIAVSGGEGIALIAGGTRVGSLALDAGSGFDAPRWNRLREAILPHLATALESAELVEQVQKKHLATIAALSRSMEAKDYYTGGHTERVAEISVALARRLGFTAADLDAVEIGALLHDIGKIGIPERILHKPGPLDDDEWKVMKEHPVISDFILSEVDLHPFVRQIARSSHERIDGKGYPDSLAGDGIPLPARIVLVADAFDALTSDRPYRPSRSVQGAMEEMRKHAGTQFCPSVIGALELLYREEPQVLGAVTLRAVQRSTAA